MSGAICAFIEVCTAQTALRTLAGGRYVWCTSAAPRSRLAYFEHLGDHDLEVYTLDGNEDAAVAASLDAAALAQMRCASGRHYVYVLTVRKQRVA